MFNYREFQEKLKIGQAAEDEAIKRINKPILIRQNAENYKVILYDFMTDDKIKYEVKFDGQSARTENIFIEFKDARGLDSGIMRTDANYFIIISSNIYHLIETNILISLIDGCRVARVRCGTLGYLLSVDKLNDNSTKI